MFDSTSMWLFIGILLLLSEFLIPGFTIFFFGIGALITSLLIVIISPLADILWLQILIFSVTSVILLVFLRKYFKNTLKGELYKEKEDYIGKECRVIETVSKNKSGRIMYQGTTWTAFSNSEKIYKNHKAVILGKKPGKLMVFIINK